MEGAEVEKLRKELSNDKLKIDAIIERYGDNLIGLSTDLEGILHEGTNYPQVGENLGISLEKAVNKLREGTASSGSARINKGKFISEKKYLNFKKFELMRDWADKLE